MTQRKFFLFFFIEQGFPPERGMPQWYMLSYIFWVHILLLTIIVLEMEKENETRHCKAYAYFQQPQTIKILNFLELSSDKIIYKGLTEQHGRKHKDFPFESISFLSEKLKHTHNPIIKSSINDLLNGKNGTTLILGNDQNKKQKMYNNNNLRLIGQPQNHGFLLQLLSCLFDTCYEKELEDKVTIKLSCCEHRDGKIGDLVGATGSKSSLNNWITEDMTEGQLVVGIPEIIIRNMKSALKVIKLFMKTLEMNRQNDEQTQNLVFTIKLQIDNEIDKHGKTTQYLISKFHIVKLSLPYCLKTPTKHSQWFITLFNYMQAQTLQKSIVNEHTSSDDAFSIYLRDYLIRRVSSVYCLTIFSNKMNANDCLTALKFTSYLQNLRLQQKKHTLNIPNLLQRKVILESDIIKAYNIQRKWTRQFCTWLPHEQNHLYLQLQMITSIHYHLMQANNILEYEYATVLSIGCDKLQKYIFNEEVQDYYYAKKMSLQPTPQLMSSLQRYLQLKKECKQKEVRYLRKLGNILSRIRRQVNESRQFKYLVNSRSKSKAMFEELFSIYNTLSTHFLYDKNQNFVQQIIPGEDIYEEAKPFEDISNNVESIIQKIDQKEAVQTVRPKTPPKKKKIIDQTQMMFTNTNVSFCSRRRK